MEQEETQDDMKDIKSNFVIIRENLMIDGETSLINEKAMIFLNNKEASSVTQKNH